MDLAVQLEGKVRQQCLRQALETAAAITDERSRAFALAAVAGRLKGAERQQCLRQALEAAVAIGDEGSRAEALAAVAGQLGGEPELLRRALEAVTAIGGEGNRAEALAAVAGQLEGEARRQRFCQALDTASGINNPGYRADTIPAMVGQLQGEPVFWEWMLQQAEQLEKAGRLKVLSVLANDWPASFGYSDFAQMLNTMGICNRIDWFELSKALAPVIRETVV
jgi:hypothetical protein